MQLETIAKKHHADIIASFWQMMREHEGTAENNNDPVLKHLVGGWYRQWNAMTGDNKEPRFIKELVVLTPPKASAPAAKPRDQRRAAITKCVKDAMASENLYDPTCLVSRLSNGSKMFRFHVGMQGYGTMQRLVDYIKDRTYALDFDITSITVFREHNKLDLLGDIIEITVGKLQD